MEKTIAERLGEFSESLSYEEISEPVLAKAKELILDTIGICVGSSTIDFGMAALRLIAGWGGLPESSLIGCSSKIPAHNAAFANGVLGHGQDYDDTHTDSVVHPSACLVPVALALGEREGSSGKEILTAFVGGMEAMIRIGMPAHNRFHLRGFHTTSICGTFGSALVTARLTGLDCKKMIEALGISGSFTSGLLECIPSGSWAKRLHAGWAGLCGVVAAELAGVDYTGPGTVFEGRLGLYNSFLRGESLDFAEITKGLGTQWEILNVRPKLYPCCHYLQSFLDCMSSLRKERHLRPEEVAQIDCRVAQGAVNIVCEPWEKKLSPKTGYDGRFSLPFAVSLMLSKGRAGVEEFSERYLEDVEIKELMRRVRYEVEPSFEVKDMPGWITLRLRNGEKVDHRIDQVRGDALHPIQREELLEKFQRNAVSLGREKSQRIGEQIFGFEALRGIGNLMKELSIPGQELVTFRPKRERTEIDPKGGCMDTKRVLLMVRIGDVPKEIEEKWNHWYNFTHIPNRLDMPGFISACRFAAIWGEYKYLTLYELASVDALTSEPYLKLRNWEASLPPDSFEAITLMLPNFSRGVYEQIYPEQGDYQIPNTEVLFTVGHDVPSDREEEFNAWYNTEHIPAMVNRVPGFLTARRFKLTEAPLTPRSGLQSPGPKYVTLYDLANENVLQTEVFLKETNSPWSTWVRSWYSRRFRILARRIYPKSW